MASPEEINILLERFQVKKQTVKRQLTSVIDDLFVDFITELSRLSTPQCPKCAATSPVQNLLLTAANFHHKQQLSPQHSLVESTLRSAHARARELIKEEFHDDSAGMARLQSSGSMSHGSGYAGSIECEPEITLTPIDSQSVTSATKVSTAVAVVPSTSPIPAIPSTSKCDSINGNEITNGHHQNNNKSHEHEQHIPPHHRHARQQGSECECEESDCQCSECVTGDEVKTEDDTQEEEVDPETEEHDEDSQSVPTPENGHSSSRRGHSSDSQDTIGEKSLEELNTLCGGLPYAKIDNKYICQFQSCGQELKSRHNLLLHQRAHLGIRPYRCKWPGCNYNSNQSSAVIRHIRTKHFQLPLTMREQQMKNIEDDRDPKAYLEVVAADSGPELSGPSSMEQNSDSLQSTPEQESLVVNPDLMVPPKTLRSNGKAKAKGSSQSLLMPQGLPPSGRGSKDALMELSTNGKSDDSDEDEYDSDENEFEVIPLQDSRARQQQQQQQQQIALQAALQLKQQQQKQHQQSQLQPQFHSKSSFDQARKRRLEAKIFANAAVSNRSSSYQNQNHYFPTNGPSSNKKQKGHPYSVNQNTLSTDSLSQQQHFGSNKQGQSYMFCPEEGCIGIFRTRIELDRHLIDVHNRIPQLQQQHQQASASTQPLTAGSDAKTYSNLYICRWPKCPFSTVLHSSAINHVRGKHFNIPRTMTAAQRRMYANDTRNPNDYIKLLPMAK